MVLRVNSFHANAATEAKCKFAEATFIKPAGRPQQTDKDGAGGWYFIGKSVACHMEVGNMQRFVSSVGLPAATIECSHGPQRGSRCH